MSEHVKEKKKIKIKRKHLLQLGVIMGVVILPLLYSYFYLGAFWDPYSRLEELPVAIVNQDTGAVIQNENRNLGNEVAEQLIEDGSLKFILTDETNALEGTEGDQYYAMILIPEDFSASVASANTTEKRTATITYSANEKRNYLASQILSRAVVEIEESVRGNIASEITNQLAEQLLQLPDSLNELEEGIGLAADGAEKLESATDQLLSGNQKLTRGADDLAEGLHTYNVSFQDFSKGFHDAKEGTISLDKGATALDSGLYDLKQGAEKLDTSTANIAAIHTGAEEIKNGLSLFQSNLVNYTAGVNSLVGSANMTSEFIQNLTQSPAWGTIVATSSTDPFSAEVLSYVQVASLNSQATADKLSLLTGSGSALNQAALSLYNGTNTLYQNTSNLGALHNGIAALHNGLKTAKLGSEQLMFGTNSLMIGVSKLQVATEKLSDASQTIESGSKDLSNGLKELESGMLETSNGATTLKDGIQELYSGVDTSVQEVNEKVKGLDGLSDFVKEPVNILTEPVEGVPNYGTAFAPYFLSLSLWVGGLIIFMGIYYDPDNKFKILSRASEKRVLRSFLYLVLGLVQALTLALIVLYGLGLKVVNIPLYLFSCCLVSLVFIAVIQFLMVFLKDIGKFISMILLILQLTSCGGTFPMETVPKFFQKLYPFMPMTYSVGLFKNTITEIDKTSFSYNGGILGSILLVFMILTLVGSVYRVKKEGKNIFELSRRKESLNTKVS